MNLFAYTLPCVGQFAGQSTRDLGRLDCRALAAADPLRYLEEGIVLGQEALGYFFCQRLKIYFWINTSSHKADKNFM